ncbi:MAG: hypothetical protein RR141_01400 [Rikenellaceae bacterium]
MISLIASGVGLVGSLLGGLGARKKAKKANSMLDDRQRSLDDWYRKEMNTDFLDTDVAKSTLSFIGNKNKKAENAMRNSAIKRSTTAEERVAMASALNQNYADSVSRLAGMGTSRKNQLQGTYMNESNKLANMKYQNQINSASTTGELGEMVGNVVNQISMLDGHGVFKKRDKSNNEEA